MNRGRHEPAAQLGEVEVRCRLWSLPILVGWIALCGQVTLAQTSAEPELAENVFLPAPRVTLQRLAQAQQLMRSERFGEAVRNLGAILDVAEDYFFQPNRDEPIHRSLKGEAQRLIGDMPPAGRDVYELQYGARARRMLADALSEGDASRLADVSRRFFHTSAGYEATFLLGLHHLDHHRPLAGAVTLDRLHSALQDTAELEPALSLAMATGWLQAGMPERAGRVLADLKAARPGGLIQLGGRQVGWFASPDEAADWLTRYTGSVAGDTSIEASQWTMLRGNPSRNASARGGAPLMNVRWEVPVADDPTIERILAQQHNQSLEQGIPPVPELHPLVVDDVVLMRTTRNLLAVDIHTGKRLWEVPVDDPLESLLQVSTEDQAHRQHVPGAMQERVLQDKTFGSVSSDGRLVYAVEDLSPSTGISHARQMVRGAVRIMPGQPQSYNRLSAHDIRTGKLRWHLGGPSDEYALRMAETFFLGPPLPLRGQLFALAETRDEIRLLALDGATGDLLWAQHLAMVEQGVLQSPVRRLSGLSPAYADGVLVCPTSAGAVVAVDLATRSLLWGYRYGQSASSRQRAPFFAVQLGRVYHGQQPSTRWADANPIIADGRVLITPADSEAIYCLDLIDGRQNWTAPREDDLYVACVHQGAVVLVGRQRVRALALADGKAAWDGRVLEFPDGGMPSGYGFYSKDTYFVPLTTAEIVAVDLDRGKTTHVARSRQGHVPGNLVSYQGMVLSQSAMGLAAFHQLDLLRDQVATRLANDPADAEALALQGELLLDEGKRDEAIRSLKASYQLASDRRTSDVLRDAMLDGLRNDFEAFRGRVDEIEPLLEEPRHHAEFLRIWADGLHRAGHWSEAFAQYLKLIEFDEDHRRVEPVDRTLSVRGDRWIRARLALLRADASGEDAAEIERLITERMQRAVEINTVDGLTRFLDYFGDNSGTAAARDALVQAQIDAGKLLEVELGLWGYPSAGDTAPVVATARVAEVLAKAEYSAEAMAAYRYLSQRYGDVAYLDGKTIRQWIDSLPEGPVARLIAAADPHWPEGRIDAQEVAANRPPTQGRFPLDFRGDPGPFFRDTVIRMDQSRRAISATDGLGRAQWSLSLVEPGSRQSFPFNPSTTYVRACGHLLVLSLGHQIIAVDTLGKPGRGQVRILWSQDLTQGGFDQTLLRFAPLGGPQLPQGVAIVQHGSHQLGSLGPVTPRYVCFQHYRNLIAVEPITGETLWVRHGVPLGSAIFGDLQHVLVASPEQSEILVLNAMDGSLVGQRPLPADERLANEPDQTLPAVQRRFAQTVMTTLGRRLVVSYVDPADGQQVLGLFDPVEQQYVWGPLRSAVGKTAHLGEELIGLLSSDGTLRLIQMDNGRALVETKLSGEANATELHLVRAGQQYLVITNRPLAQNQARQINPLPGTQYRAIGSGRVYAFDFDGTPLWPEPALIESQLLLLHQPEDLPVFVFASQAYDAKKEGAERFSAQVVCLDKRNGRIVYRGAFSGPTATFEMAGDPETHTIEIQLQRNVVRLLLTDAPLPPEGPADAEDEGARPVEASPTKPAAALFKAFGEAIMKSDVLLGGARNGLRPRPAPPEPAKP